MTTAPKPTRKVIILRGLPGSGKSTWAINGDGNEGAVICSADHWFGRSGSYVFRPEELSTAHAKCYRKFLDALMDKAPLVIVDNTNTQRWEYNRYAAAARDMGYEVEIKAFECSVEESFKRNVHGVPKETIERMAKRWEK